jgi:MFS family permease
MVNAFPILTPDAWLLFATRFIRLFAYGSLSVVLVFYLADLGLTELQIGVLLTVTLIGDTAVSLYLTTRADRIGRRRMLIVGAALMAGAGLVFAFTRIFWLLVLAGTIGVISPSGHEVGPFLSIEQAALSHVVTDRTRTRVFAWYTLAGSLATALGALAAGALTRMLQHTTTSPIGAYRTVVILYAAIGVVLAALFSRLSALSRQRYRMVARAGYPTRLDQPLLAEMSKVARSWIGRTIVAVSEITTGDHSKRADGCECSRFRTAQRVLAITIVHDLALASSRQIGGG